MISGIVNWVNTHQRDILLLVCIGLVGIAAFNLGRLSVSHETPVSVIPAGGGDGLENDARNESAPTIRDSRVVVSRSSSSKKYHHAWCPGAKSIKEENRIWFETAMAAEAAGYSLAGNCR